jgi:glycosyltransferase involved in cell wall biosynthesis
MVMHYRVSIYNYFYRRFHELGFEFTVVADRLQEQNQIPMEFRFLELPFGYFSYKKAIADFDPAAVILFLRLKDWVIWPLVHWLKFRKIPFAFWSKGGNWDEKGSHVRYHLFNYVHGISDALILYSKDCLQFVKPRFQSKAYIASNTINFEEFPRIYDSKEEIKREFAIPFEKVVLFVGRMGAGKGRKRVDHLVDIFSSMERQDVGLVIVGSGLSEDVRARINPHNTIYLGEIHDARDLGISKLFKMADICAIPGHVGLGLNQAFFWGLPVITEEGEHPPEIAYLNPGRNGFIVPRNDTVSLRERVVYLLEHDDVRADFSRNAKEDILNEASIEGMFSGFKECVQFLTQR